MANITFLHPSLLQAQTITQIIWLVFSQQVLQIEGRWYADSLETGKMPRDGFTEKHGQKWHATHQNHCQKLHIFPWGVTLCRWQMGRASCRGGITQSNGVGRTAHGMIRCRMRGPNVWRLLWRGVCWCARGGKLGGLLAPIVTSHAPQEGGRSQTDSAAGTNRVGNMCPRRTWEKGGLHTN